MSSLTSSEKPEKKRKRQSEKEDRPRKKKTAPAAATPDAPRRASDVDATTSTLAAIPSTPAATTATTAAAPVVAGATETPTANSSSSRKKKNKENKDNRVGKDSIKLIHVPKEKDFDLVVVTAPGFTIPPDLRLEAYSSKDELLLHSSEHPRLDYTAREQQEGGLEGQMKHYIGVYDPDKREMQLIEARKMCVRSTLRAEEEEMRGAKQTSRESMMAARKALGAEFGTKKAKKALSSLVENAVSSAKPGELSTAESIKKAIERDPTARAVVQSLATGAASAPTKEATQLAIDSAKPRPKRNDEATTVDEVYTIADLVGDDVMRLVKVKPWFDAIDAGEDVSTTSRYVANRLKPLVAAEDVKKAKVLRFILLLLEFYNGLQKGVKGSSGKRVPKTAELQQKLNVDSTLIEIVKRRFTDSGTSLTKWHVDNLITHIAALALIVDDFQTDVGDLREDLALKRQDMEKYFRETGAKVDDMTETQREKARLTKDEATMHRQAKLSLPLQFPKERSQHKRK